MTRQAREVRRCHLVREDLGDGCFENVEYFDEVKVGQRVGHHHFLLRLGNAVPCLGHVRWVRVGVLGRRTPDHRIGVTERVQDDVGFAGRLGLELASRTIHELCALRDAIEKLPGLAACGANARA